MKTRSFLSMRKGFLVMFLALFVGGGLLHSPPAFGQLPAQTKKITVAKDSTVNTDNTSITIPVDAYTRSVDYTATKVSGYVRGKAVLQGLSNDGLVWIGIDSATLTNQTYNYKKFVLPDKLPHNGYRIYVATDTTCKVKPIAAWTLRRSG